MWLGVVEKNWAFSVDQWQLQALLFSVHLIDLLSILLRCNGFTEIQKTVVDQSSSRLPNSDHDSKYGFGKCSGASSQFNHRAGHCWLSHKIHFSSHITIHLRCNPLLLFLKRCCFCFLPVVSGESSLVIQIIALFSACGFWWEFFGYSDYCSPECNISWIF